MKYKSKKSQGALVGLIMGILIFGFSFWGIGFSLGPEDKALKLLLYIPAFLFLFIYIILLMGSFNLHYLVQKNRLALKWGLISAHIPWTDINQLIKVEGESNLFSILGASWPGYMVGLYSAKGLGPVKMYTTKPYEGFVCIKSNKGFWGLTPEDDSLIEEIASKTGKEIETVDMNQMPEEIKGKSMKEDGFYKLLFILNLVFLLFFSVYLAVFFPGSTAPNFIVLLLVLAVALFFFNIGNAGRLYQFSTQGAYFLLLIGIAVTGIFLILSLGEISL